MKTPPSDPIAEALAVVEFLTGKVGMRLDDTDRYLLSLGLPKYGELAWGGGVFEDPSLRLVLRLDVTCTHLDATQSLRVASIAEQAYAGFFAAAADGAALVRSDLIIRWWGEPLQENYPEAGPAFLRFATTYWTLKIALSQLDLGNQIVVAREVLAHIDSLVGMLFFPTPGPLPIHPDRRELDQRRFLEVFAPQIDREDFIRNNPILIRDRRDPQAGAITW